MATFYVAETALGNGSGSSALNAKAMSWLNDRYSWNGDVAGATICSNPTASTVRDEVHFVGTITTAFDWPYATGVGAAGLKFYFEPNAKFSRPHWAGGRGCAIFWESAAYGKHNVEIDFGVNGCIECTDNGTNLTYQQPSAGIVFQSARNVTITNPRIYNMFVRVFGTGQGRTSAGIAAQCNSGPITDLTITGGVIHDCDIGISTNALTAGCARYTIQGVEIYNINWGIGCGLASAGATMEDFVARGNYIHDFECWDVPLGIGGLEDFHHNAIFLYGEPTGVNFINGLIEGNILGPNFGTRATSAVYLSHWTMKGTYIVRNNIMIGAPNDGLVATGTAAGSTVYVHNNTFVVTSPGNAAVNAGGSYAGAGMNIHLRNNIVSGGSYLQVNYAANVNVDSDYNLIYGYTPSFPGPVTRGLTSSVGAIPWATWQSSYGQDAHSIIDDDPLLDSDGRPGTGSPALEAGADLSAYFTGDYDGVTRVAPWDMGAFEGPSTPTAPNFITQPISQTVTSGDDVTLTVLATGSPAPTYQWRLGGDDLGGERSSVLALENLTTGGVFDCVATNSQGSDTSDAAVITVLASSGSENPSPLGHRGSRPFAVCAF